MLWNSPRSLPFPAYSVVATLNCVKRIDNHPRRGYTVEVRRPFAYLRKSRVTSSVVAVARAALLGALIGLTSAQTVVAQNMLPTPWTWWDHDRDRIAEPNDSIVGFGSLGGSWTAEKHADVVASTAAWSTVSDYNPFDATGGGTIRAYVQVDNTVQWCFNNWHPVIVGFTCSHYEVMKEGGVVSYWRLLDSIVGINKVNYSWNYGADDPAGHQYDFRGILTHELGHTARLIHPGNCGNPVLTMCAAGPVGTWSKQLRTLEANDVSEVNRLYP